MKIIEFKQELAKIEDLLFGFAMKLTRNRDNAKDLMQETLTQAFDKRDRFQVGTNFKAWVTTIMYNAHISNYRRNKTRSKVVKPIENYQHMVEHRSVRNNIQSHLMLKELHAMVDRLSYDFKVPFEMFTQGYHYDEICEKMDLPMGTVKSRIFYARKKLQKMLSENYDLGVLRAA